MQHQAHSASLLQGRAAGGQATCLASQLAGGLVAAALRLRQRRRQPEESCVQLLAFRHLWYRCAGGLGLLLKAAGMAGLCPMPVQALNACGSVPASIDAGMVVAGKGLKQQPRRVPQLRELGTQLWLSSLEVLHAQLARPGGVADWAASCCGGHGSSVWLLANLAVPAGTALQASAPARALGQPVLLPGAQLCSSERMLAVVLMAGRRAAMQLGVRSCVCMQRRHVQVQTGAEHPEARLSTSLKFAEVVHQLLCSLPTSAMDDTEEEAAESATVATLLQGEPHGTRSAASSLAHGWRWASHRTLPVAAQAAQAPCSCAALLTIRLVPGLSAGVQTCHPGLGPGRPPAPWTCSSKCCAAMRASGRCCTRCCQLAACSMRICPFGGCCRPRGSLLPPTSSRHARLSTPAPLHDWQTLCRLCCD